MSSGGSFWTSFGGILAGVAAVITAVASFIGVWYQLDGPSEKPPYQLVSPSEKPPPSWTSSPNDPPATPPPDPKNERTDQDTTIKVGDAVISRWDDGCLYPSTVREIEEDNYLVYYDFSSERWVDAGGVVKPIAPLASSLGPGVETLVRVDEIRTKWVPSVIRDVRDGRYYLAFDEGIRCVSTRTHMWARPDQLVVPN